LIKIDIDSARVKINMDEFMHQGDLEETIYEEALAN
jgi:hypothetical protein